MKARFYKQTFQFKFDAGTSRGVLREKSSWFLEVWNEDKPEVKGIGECSVITGLSPDYQNDAQYESKLEELCENFDTDVNDWPSIKFGLETALLNLEAAESECYFKNSFFTGEQHIPINGLVWMGDESFMKQQIEDKLAAGFSTIKMKIGAIDLDTELKLLRSIRDQYSSEEITLRVDANGAFSPEDAERVLAELSRLEVHSIEQPIKTGQWDDMARLCSESPIPIALDEEMIGVNLSQDKIKLLDNIDPHFIILKPSLHGGISGTSEWIKLANERQIDWWITSALESNVGLNAICQFTANYDNPLPQGLGTGSLYTNNNPSALVVENAHIYRKK